MEVAVKSFFMGLSPEISSQRQRQRLGFRTKAPSSQNTMCSFYTRNVIQEYHSRVPSRNASMACAVSPSLEIQHPSTSSFKDYTVCADSCGDRDIKVRVDVSGAKTQAIFDDVFSKLVEAAQPIPGFRRMKGGKTPDIPREILLHILGPSKVNRQTIKKIINSTMVEYVAKEGLKVTKDLRVEQSFEELEGIFVPGREFGFDATIQLQEIK